MRAALRRLGAAVPVAGWLCAGVALLNFSAWALLTPPFHVADETAHFAYVQHLAETGRPPTGKGGMALSEEQQRTMDAVGFASVAGRVRDKPPWTQAQDRWLREIENEGFSRRSDGGYTPATNNPPLYYALEAIPYKLSPSTTLLGRMFFMRLLSALIGALSILFVFLFLRELLSGTPWAWTAGSLVAAFQPLLGQVSGGVHNDNALILAASASFFLLARGFRHGLSTGLGAAIGATVAFGLLGKATFLGFVPGIAAGVGLLTWRVARVDRGQALRVASAALGLALAPVLLYALVNGIAWDRPLWGGGAGAVAGSIGSGEVKSGLWREQLSYFWQLFLPRLPFMHDQFVGYFPLWETWVRGFIARFGWLDYGFDAGPYKPIAAVLGAVSAMAGVELVRRRDALRARWPELATYASAMLGLLALIAVAGYSARLSNYGYPFEQARYLLPLLALYGAIVGLAVRLGGARRGPVMATVLVLLAITHDLLGLIATMERYYA